MQLKAIGKMIRVFVLLLVCGNAAANEIIFYKGVNQEFGMTFSEQQKNALPILTQVTKANTEKANSTRSIAFTNFNEGDKWYRLYENFFISGVDIKSKSYLGGMEIGAFNDPELEQEIQTLYSSYEITPTPRTYENLLPILGCYIQNPLRYGDATGDGSLELAVFAQDEYGAFNINIFSTAVKKVIFSGRIATYDARINDRLVLADGEQETASNPLANAPTNGQYLSGIAEDNTRMVKGIQSAAIGFSKIYVADIDGDEVQELIQWRKLYKSRENQDPIKGFEKNRDTFIHYKLVDGEYKKQSTEQGVIKGWLEAKNLTWQKGYPSKSECPGKEGQLIPEMHDPLLNDPDVLK